MPHNDSATKAGAWLIPTQRELGRMDIMQSQSVNGDDGATGVGGDLWAPSTPIIIGGSGVQTTTSQTSIEGGITTASGGRLNLGDNDVPTFSPNRTTRRVMMLANPQTIQTGWYRVAPSFAPYGVRVLEAGATWSHTIPQIYLRNGATLNQVALRLRIGQQPAALPGTQYPGFRVWRHNVGNTTTQDLFAASYKYMTAPADPVAYFNNGQTQTITMTCNQNNTSIDTSSWIYGITIADATGTGIMPGNLFLMISLSLTAISDLRFE